MKQWISASVLLVGLGLGGCGPTVGDACTVDDDCGAGLCLNRDFAPGGSCSLTCQLEEEDTCPRGSVCVADVLGRDGPGCLRACDQTGDCRSGYTCEQVAPATKACVGPDGF